jgi:hypothetical protein
MEFVKLGLYGDGLRALFPSGLLPNSATFILSALLLGKT